MTFFVLIIAMSSDKIEEAAETLMTKGTGETLVLAEHKDSGIFATKVRSRSRIDIDAAKTSYSYRRSRINKRRDGCVHDRKRTV